MPHCCTYLLFFFSHTATTEIYTFPYTTLFRSLGYDTVVTSEWGTPNMVQNGVNPDILLKGGYGHKLHVWEDRKSTRLNSSHGYISYAVFCLKKKKSRHYNLLQHRICIELTPAC